MNNETKVSQGTILHPVLLPGIVKRIKAYKYALGDVEPASLERTIDDFKRDLNLEKELVIWERIASTFTTYLAHNPTNDPVIRKEVFAVILCASTGENDWSMVKHLSPDQIKHIVLNYTGV